MSCKDIGPKTAVIVFLAMIKVIVMKLAKFLIAKSLKPSHRNLIQTICMLFLRVESFQQTIIEIEEDF